MLRSTFGHIGPSQLRAKIFPRERIASGGNFDANVDSGVISGYEPDAPFISRTTPVLNAGSCFAANVAQQLSAAGYSERNARFTDLLFTPPAIQFFLECLLDERWDAINSDLWALNRVD